MLFRSGFFEPNTAWSSQIETELLSRFYFIESQNQTTSDGVVHKYYNVIKVTAGYALRKVGQFGLFADAQIGRASCRERVYISVVAVS